jgi:hypothetical protein
MVSALALKFQADQFGFSLGNANLGTRVAVWLYADTLFQWIVPLELATLLAIYAYRLFSGHPRQPRLRQAHSVS